MDNLERIKELEADNAELKRRAAWYLGKLVEQNGNCIYCVAWGSGVRKEPCNSCDYPERPNFTPAPVPADFEVKESGDQLLPDGRVIQRETVPNRLMDMLKEVQETCQESGLQEFALKCFNWIEELREQAGLTEKELAKSIGMNGYSYNFMNHADDIDIYTIFRLINAAKQEAKQ